MFCIVIVIFLMSDVVRNCAGNFEAVFGEFIIMFLNFVFVIIARLSMNNFLPILSTVAVLKQCIIFTVRPSFSKYPSHPQTN